MFSKKVLISLLGILLVLGFALFVYRDISKVGTSESSDLTVATTTPGKPEFKIERVIDEQSPAVSSSGIIAPKLGKPIVFTVELNSAQKKETTDAILAFEKKLTESDALISDWLTLAIYRKASGDIVSAKEIWEYITKRWPGDFVAYSNLGDLYHYQLKDYQKAEFYLRKTIDSSFKNIGAYINLYNLYHFSYKEKSENAPLVLMEGISKYGDNPDLLIALAVYYKESGNNAEARTEYEKALTLAQNANNTKLATSIKEEIAALSK